jgi:hypothetical protein
MLYLFRARERRDLPHCNSGYSPRQTWASKRPNPQRTAAIRLILHIYNIHMQKERMITQIWRNIIITEFYIEAIKELSIFVQWETNILKFKSYKIIVF